MGKKIAVVVLGVGIGLIQLTLGAALVREGFCDHGESYSDNAKPPPPGFAGSVLRCQYPDEKKDYDARYEPAEKDKMAEEHVATAALKASYRANEIAAAQLWVSVLEALAVTIALSVAAVGLIVQAVEVRRRRRR